MIRSLIILLLLAMVPNVMAAKKTENKSKPVVSKTKTSAKKETKKQKPAAKKTEDTDPVIGVKKFEFVGVKKTPPNAQGHFIQIYDVFSVRRLDPGHDCRRTEDSDRERSAFDPRYDR
jgi:hypothetical protein